MKLTDIARALRRQIEESQTSWAQRALFGGLIVLLHQPAPDRWRLAIARERAPPSHQECQTVGAAFGVPAGCVWERSIKKHNGERLHVAEVVYPKERKQ